jgi:DMSO/TMAO reductase YedYZ molybdopterin-dependent catalytic subunit
MHVDRRTLLGAASVLGAGLLLPRSVRADAAPGTGLIELSNRPPNYESPLDVFTTRVTPTDRFYIRSHHDTPMVDLATWRLAVDGLVDAPQQLSLADLEKLPQVELEAVLQCAGNGRALMAPRVPGVQWTKGAMGNAVWKGPRLKDVLALARPKAQGTMLQLLGADRPVMTTTPTFTRAVPMTKALHEDTILALRMNGRPLPRLHGGPARLVMPGWVADGWTKWAQTLTVLDGEPKGFFWETAYRYPTTPGKPGEPVPKEQMKPMEHLVVKSVIGAPTTGTVHAPGKVDVVGVAFSGGEKIARVDVSIDGGPWQKAKITDDGGRYGFSVFAHSAMMLSGTHTVRSRATDAKGAVQPEQAVWNPSGYLHNAIDVLTIEVRG